MLDVYDGHGMREGWSEEKSRSENDGADCGQRTPVATPIGCLLTMWF